MRFTAVVLLLALCLCGCGAKKPERIAPSRSTDPIRTTVALPNPDEPVHTPVYVTIFKNTAYLSTYPRDKIGEEEPECKPRNIAKGGTVLCGCEHLQETPITRVVIVDRLYPDSTADWFRNMATLRVIEGFGNLNVDQVTDMSNMFRGCAGLSGIDLSHWKVGEDVDTTGMFDGCDAWGDPPAWYQE